jgi:hypothetical protein
MFLASEASTQLVEKATPLEGVASRWVGSVMSGFSVGFFQGYAEYRKKLLSQRVLPSGENGWLAILKTAQNSGQLTSLRRRLTGAACCSAVFDSTFFASRHVLSEHLPAPAAYSISAATAILVAFPFDTAVARMHVVPPDQPVEPFSTHIRRVAKLRFAAYRGCPSRVVEFAISYAITGLMSLFVLH